MRVGEGWNRDVKWRVTWSCPTGRRWVNTWGCAGLTAGWPSMDAHPAHSGQIRHLRFDSSTNHQHWHVRNNKFVLQPSTVWASWCLMLWFCSFWWGIRYTPFQSCFSGKWLTRLHNQLIMLLQVVCVASVGSPKDMSTVMTTVRLHTENVGKITGKYIDIWVEDVSG